MTTMNDIREMVNRYDCAGYSHVVIVCDTYDYGDYPVGVKIGEDVQKVIEEYSGQDMQKVMEEQFLK